MTLDYFYGQAGELFSFYRIPKALFQEPRFQNLSTDAKTLYGILLDRMSLSAKNGWLDEQGRVFIIFTIEDVKRALCCADNKATKLLRELEKFGLIERKRRGLGKPSLVYVKNFSAESSKSIFQNRDFHDSGGFKSASQDPAKSRCNKTDENNTEKSETYPFYSEEADEMSKREQLKEYFSQSLEVELLLRLCPDDEDAVCEAKQSTQEEMNRLASLLPEYEVVMQMEGTGPITGPALMAEIGDVRRFKNKKALVAFAGILKNALDLYHGKVLSSADGEHWLIQFSTKYHLSYMGAVSELLKQLDSLHSYDLLNQYAMKSLTIAPDNPKAYCWLIRSLKAQGMNELATNELAAAKEHLTTEEYEEILAFGANW